MTSRFLFVAFRFPLVPFRFMFVTFRFLSVTFRFMFLAFGFLLVTFRFPFVRFRLFFVTNVEHFKTFCSMISTFGTAISTESRLLSSKRLMKSEQMKADRAGRSKDEPCLALTKEKAGQSANKFAHSKSFLECVWLATALFPGSTHLQTMAFPLPLRTNGGFEWGYWLNMRP